MRSLGEYRILSHVGNTTYGIGLAC
jgi:hypothetical protein